jgi:hypothetical protein
MLEPDKKGLSPLLYHLSFIVELAKENPLTWYPSREVSRGGPSNTLVAISHLEGISEGFYFANLNILRVKTQA